MASALPIPLPVSAPRPVPAPACPLEARLVPLLRRAASAGRAEARVPLAACAAIDPAAPAETHARALLRALPGALRRRPRLWAPGAEGRSFDEAWLLALARALSSGDGDSSRFLLGRRARPEAAPLLAALMRALVARLDENLEPF
jgi:hypothetical protein